jgi:hypothetical protein
LNLLFLFLLLPVALIITPMLYLSHNQALQFKRKAIKHLTLNFFQVRLQCLFSMEWEACVGSSHESHSCHLENWRLRATPDSPLPPSFLLLGTTCPGRPSHCFLSDKTPQQQHLMRTPSLMLLVPCSYFKGCKVSVPAPNLEFISPHCLQLWQRVFLVPFRGLQTTGTS